MMSLFVRLSSLLLIEKNIGAPFLHVPAISLEQNVKHRKSIAIIFRKVATKSGIFGCNNHQKYHARSWRDCYIWLTSCMSYLLSSYLLYSLHVSCHIADRNQRIRTKHYQQRDHEPVTSWQESSNELPLRSDTKDTHSQVIKRAKNGRN